jgi:hypothetical protein
MGLKVRNSVWVTAFAAIAIVTLGFFLTFCDGVVSPDRYYWAICEAPGYGYIHEGPYDTRQAALDRAWELEDFYRQAGIYLDCEIREQAGAPFAER